MFGVDQRDVSETNVVSLSQTGRLGLISGVSVSQFGSFGVTGRLACIGRMSVSQQPLFC